MQNPVDQDKLNVLEQEKESLSVVFENAHRLLAEEIENLKTGKQKEASGDNKDLNAATPQNEFIAVHDEKTTKLQVNVVIPAKQYPRINFVGKLLGPKGSTLKQLQEETFTHMSVFGRGSMRDKDKEEEQRKSGDPKYQHLNHDLHVHVVAIAKPSDAYARISHALQELSKFLIPDPAELQGQMQFNGMGQRGGRGGGMRGRGGPPSRGGPGSMGGRGAPGGMPAQRGMAPPRGAPGAGMPARGNRGGMAPRGMPAASSQIARGAGAMRGSPSARGAPRGVAPRGAAPMMRGGGAQPPARSMAQSFDVGYDASYGYEQQYEEPLPSAVSRTSYDMGMSSMGYEQTDPMAVQSTGYVDDYGAQPEPDYGLSGQVYDQGFGVEDQWAAAGHAPALPMAGGKAPPMRSQPGAMARAHPYAPVSRSHYG